MHSAYRVRLWDISAMRKVTNILYMCGKDMAARYNLHHWDNCYVKTAVIVLIGILKNRVYLVCNGKEPIATFQVRKVKKALFFEKLATLPSAAKQGVGTFCLEEIENLGRSQQCDCLICDVYDKSEHAKKFYEHRGYAVYADVQVGEFSVQKLRKEIRDIL